MKGIDLITKVKLINNLTGIELDVNKHVSELDEKLESIIEEEIKWVNGMK